MAGFALADRSAGFVWGLQTSEGSATYLRPYDDDRIFVQYVGVELDTAPAEVLRQRHAWFEKFSGVYTASWWIPNGRLPSVVQESAPSR